MWVIFQLWEGVNYRKEVPDFIIIIIEENLHHHTLVEEYLYHITTGNHQGTKIFYGGFCGFEHGINWMSKFSHSLLQRISRKSAILRNIICKT